MPIRPRAPLNLPKLIWVRFGLFWFMIEQRNKENDKMQTKGYLRIRFFFKILPICELKPKWVVSRGRLLKQSMACHVSHPVFHRWRGSPKSLFGWNIGRSKDAERPQPKYHDIDLPFSLSLVSKTFLNGTLFICLPSLHVFPLQIKF